MPIRPLRVWPVILLLLLLWGLRIGGGLADEMSFGVMLARFMGPLGLSGLIVLWWILLSRALVREKLIGTVVLTAIAGVTTILADKTIMGFGTMIFAIPWGISAFAVAAICLRSHYPARTMVALLAALIGFGYWDLIRTDEIRGDFQTVQRWRWEPTPEDQFMETLASRPSSSAAATTSADQPLAEPDWPAFRGHDRRGEQSGIVLEEDWDAARPTEIWRIPVGPGWSSFSVAGERLFTQQQRGEYEAIVCYSAVDGSELWAHQDESRFWEVVGGAGPRGTPTIAEGRLYALGANGLLTRLDPVTGNVDWQRDISGDADRDPPTWGFSSSPLVTHGVVIVHAGGEEDKGILAYDQSTGDLRWSAPAGNHSYSSPQLSTVDERQCVLMLSNAGVAFVDPEDGRTLGSHVWEMDGYRVVQPLVLEDSSVLIGTPMGNGTQRAAVRWNGENFETEDIWTSNRMNPYFNDYVAHEGFLYGFDNNIFACIDLENGERKWKRGRYGNGQVLLLPSGDQLLVISERGELVLLRATPERWTELARHSVLEGRTWNHPVLIGNRLYVRNAEEAACFELKVKPSSESQAAELWPRATQHR